MFKFIISLRIFLWLMLAIFVGWLIWQVVIPSGRVTYVNDFSHYSDFIVGFSPKERLAAAEKGQQKLLGDPVYFNLRTTRPFSHAKLTLTYRSQGAPIIEAGLLLDKSTWRYALKPVANQIIDKLYHDKAWGVLEDDGVILLQRQEKYSSIKNFLASPPDPKTVAVYNYQLPDNFKPADNKPARYKKVDSDFILDDQIKYIIAGYSLPDQAGDWQTTVVDFDLAGADRRNDSYEIILSMPGLKNDDGKNNAVILKNIKAELTSSAWRDWFKKI